MQTGILPGPGRPPEPPAGSVSPGTASPCPAPAHGGSRGSPDGWRRELFPLLRRWEEGAPAASPLQAPAGGGEWRGGGSQDRPRRRGGLRGDRSLSPGRRAGDKGGGVRGHAEPPGPQPGWCRRHGGSAEASEPSPPARGASLRAAGAWGGGYPGLPGLGAEGWAPLTHLGRQQAPPGLHGEGDPPGPRSTAAAASRCRAGPAAPRALERPAPALAACQPGSLAGSAAEAAAAAGSQRPLAGPRGSARHCGTAGEAVRSLPHPRPAAWGAGQAAQPPPARPPTAGSQGRKAGGVAWRRGRTAAPKREPDRSALPPPSPGSRRACGPAARPRGHGLPPTHTEGGTGRRRNSAAGSPAKGLREALPTPREGTYRCPGTARDTDGRTARGCALRQERYPQAAATAPTHRRTRGWEPFMFYVAGHHSPPGCRDSGT